jgi:hypothetical protein
MTDETVPCADLSRSSFFDDDDLQPSVARRDRYKFDRAPGLRTQHALASSTVNRTNPVSMHITSSETQDESHARNEESQM